MNGATLLLTSDIDIYRRHGMNRYVSMENSLPNIAQLTIFLRILSLFYFLKDWDFFQMLKPIKKE